MHVLEKAFIDLLYNSLPIPNQFIFTGSRYIPADHTPCVNIQMAAESFIRKHYVEIDTIQHIRRLYSAEVWINIWCNTEEERTSLIDAVTTRFNQLEAHHYTTCSNFDFTENNCKITGECCEALTSQSGRANKGQCPNLEIYTSFFETNLIPERSFHIQSMTDLDELTESESVLRTIFKLEMEYYKLNRIGGRVFQDIKINEDLL